MIRETPAIGSRWTDRETGERYRVIGFEDDTILYQHLREGDVRRIDLSSWHGLMKRF